MNTSLFTLPEQSEEVIQNIINEGYTYAPAIYPHVLDTSLVLEDKKKELVKIFNKYLEGAGRSYGDRETTLMIRIDFAHKMFLMIAINIETLLQLSREQSRTWDLFFTMVRRKGPQYIEEIIRSRDEMTSLNNEHLDRIISDIRATINLL